MYKDGTKSGGKVRAPVSSEQAAVFRAACSRLGIDHRSCSERLGIQKTVFYEYGNGEARVPETVSKLLDSIESYNNLLKAFEELQDEVDTMKGNRE
jgi:hypothetical protein